MPPTRARVQRGAKRKRYLTGREERERLAGLPDSWLTPRGRMYLLAVLLLLLAGGTGDDRALRGCARLERCQRTGAAKRSQLR
jgi:hypothetical protein